MDGDWETVKQKPKKQNKKPKNDDKPEVSYGGKTKSGMLIAGPIREGKSYGEQMEEEKYD